MISPKEYRALVAAAARLYVAAGRHPYYFARGKLGHDPVFPELLSRGIVREDARILDLGCGQGVLGALFLSARELYQSGVWPVSWPAPPKSIRLYGIELQDRVAGWGRSALNGRATLVTGDLRSVALPDADLVVILDVLHYLDPDSNRAYWNGSRIHCAAAERCCFGSAMRPPDGEPRSPVWQTSYPRWCADRGGRRTTAVR